MLIKQLLTNNSNPVETFWTEKWNKDVLNKQNQENSSPVNHIETNA